MNGAIRPRRRTEGFIVEELDDELLIYDTQRDKAHALNDTVALVWKKSTGRVSIDQIARQISDLDDPEARREIVLLALRQLQQRKLIEPIPSLPEDVSRRDLMRKLAWAGAVGVSIPVVKSIVAPTAAQAATCFTPGTPCASSAQCCSGVCSGGFCL